MTHCGGGMGWSLRMIAGSVGSVYCGGGAVAAVKVGFQHPTHHPLELLRLTLLRETLGICNLCGSHV